MAVAERLVERGVVERALAAEVRGREGGQRARRAIRAARPAARCRAARAARASSVSGVTAPETAMRLPRGQPALRISAAGLGHVRAVGRQLVRRQQADRAAERVGRRRCAARASARPASSGVQPPLSRSRCTAASSRPTPRSIAPSVISRSAGGRPACGSAANSRTSASSAISAGEREQHAADHREQVGAERALVEVAEGFAGRVANVGGVGRHERQHADRLRRQQVGLIAPLQRRLLSPTLLCTW